MRVCSSFIVRASPDSLNKADWTCWRMFNVLLRLSLRLKCRFFIMLFFIPAYLFLYGSRAFVVDMSWGVIFPGEVHNCGCPGHGGEPWIHGGGFSGGGCPTCLTWLSWLMASNRGTARIPSKGTARNSKGNARIFNMSRDRR